MSICGMNNMVLLSNTSSANSDNCEKINLVCHSGHLYLSSSRFYGANSVLSFCEGDIIWGILLFLCVLFLGMAIAWYYIWLRGKGKQPGSALKSGGLGREIGKMGLTEIFRCNGEETLKWSLKSIRLSNRIIKMRIPERR